MTWNLQRDGRAWREEALSRYDMAPEKIEMFGGLLFGSHDERVTMLGLLLENVGADTAVRLGDLDVWQAAIDARRSAQHVGRDDEARGKEPIDRRELEAEMLQNLRAQREGLTALLASCSDHWGFEDPVYRYYHQSYKVYALQHQTDRIVSELRALLPSRALNPWFLDIVRRGTGKVFEVSDNARWTDITRPILEAFFHARFFLDMAVRYSTLDQPPSRLPSGYAALLYLYQLR
ncbi:MAG: hypothetical protein ABMA15_25635 [Vicinamibacterales bacterium]